jgi:hypothetical protein
MQLFLCCSNYYEALRAVLLISCCSYVRSEKNTFIFYIVPSHKIKYNGLKSGLRGGQEIGSALSIHLLSNNITKMFSFGWHPFCSAPYKIDLENRVINLY